MAMNSPAMPISMLVSPLPQIFMYENMIKLQSSPVIIWKWARKESVKVKKFGRDGESSGITPP